MCSLFGIIDYKNSLPAFTRRTMILADLGYDALEIEELMYDPVMLREIVSECREMMACELRG